MEYDYNSPIDEARVFQRCETNVFLAFECRQQVGPQIFNEGDVRVCCYENRCNTLELLEEAMATAKPPNGRFASCMAM